MRRGREEKHLIPMIKSIDVTIFKACPFCCCCCWLCLKTHIWLSNKHTNFLFMFAQICFMRTKQQQYTHTHIKNICERNIITCFFLLWFFLLQTFFDCKSSFSCLEQHTKSTQNYYNTFSTSDIIIIIIITTTKCFASESNFCVFFLLFLQNKHKKKLNFVEVFFVLQHFF